MISYLLPPFGPVLALMDEPEEWIAGQQPQSVGPAEMVLVSVTVGAIGEVAQSARMLLDHHSSRSAMADNQLNRCAAPPK